MSRVEFVPDPMRAKRGASGQRLLREHKSLIFGTNSGPLFPKVSAVQMCIILYLSVESDEDIAYTCTIENSR